MRLSSDISAVVTGGASGLGRATVEKLRAAKRLNSDAAGELPVVVPLMVAADIADNVGVDRDESGIHGSRGVLHAGQHPPGFIHVPGVADLGAGGGWFTMRLARRVGPNGRVYAQDVQQEMIVSITQRVANQRLTNVQTILATESDPRLPEGLDAVLVVDT